MGPGAAWEIADAASSGICIWRAAAGGSGVGGVQFATVVAAVDSRWLYSAAGFSGTTEFFGLVQGAELTGAGGAIGSGLALGAGMPMLPVGAGNSSYSSGPDGAALSALGGSAGGAGRTGGMAAGCGGRVTGAELDGTAGASRRTGVGETDDCAFDAGGAAGAGAAAGAPSL